jgi:hypothetical protein
VRINEGPFTSFNGTVDEGVRASHGGEPPHAKLQLARNVSREKRARDHLRPRGDGYEDVTPLRSGQTVRLSAVSPQAVPVFVDRLLPS